MIQIIEDPDDKTPCIKLEISSLVFGPNRLILYLQEEDNEDMGIFEIFRNLFKMDGA